MKCIRSDIRRAIVGRWFLVAFAATVVSLWLSIGEDSYYLLRSIKQGVASDFASLFQKSLLGQFGALTLPALSAMPFAAVPLMELKSGAARSAIFRTGRVSYVLGKVLGCVLGGMVLQGGAFALFVLALSAASRVLLKQAIPINILIALVPMVLSRMLCGGLWACAGGTLALLTETSSAAYVGPLCLCYALMMVGTRFFPKVLWISPMNWLQPVTFALATGCALLAAVMGFVIQREVQKRV